MKSIFLSFILSILGISVLAQSNQSVSIKIQVEAVDIISKSKVREFKITLYKRIVGVGQDGVLILHPLSESIKIIEKTLSIDNETVSFSTLFDNTSSLYAIYIDAEGYNSQCNSLVKIDANSNEKIAFNMVRALLSEEDKTIIENFEEEIIYKKDSIKQYDLQKSGDETQSYSNLTPESILACSYNVPTQIYVKNLSNGYNSPSCPSSGIFTGMMPFDEYVAGAVGGELGTGTAFPLESKKAQAVAARTYALKKTLSSSTSGGNCGQAYSSTSCSTCVSAASATIGQVILYNSGLIDALYSARCSGNYTQSSNEGTYSPQQSCALTGNALAYLVAKQCSGHTNCQSVTGETPCCLAYNSTTRTNGYLYGHGVGLCQRGSQQFANNGLDYLAILNKFYSGICVANSEVTAAPPNDNCSGAIDLTSSTSCNYTSGTVIGATSSGVARPSVCDNVSTGLLDVWYKFTATQATHYIKITPNTIGSSGLDAVVAVYGGTCSNLVYIGCLDPTGYVEVNITLNGAVVNSTYYVRVYDYGNRTAPDGTFKICITHQGSSCTHSISPTSQNFQANGGSGSFTVTANPIICTWSATSNCSWVTLNNSSGSGGGTINYNVSSNTSTSSRTCTITVNSQTYTITQSGASCSYSISASSQSFTSAGGSGSFNLTTLTGCTWTASADCNWVTVTNTSGNGASAISYNVSSNTTTSSRTCTININGQVYTITQAGVSQLCAYSFNPSGNTYTFEEQIGRLNVVVNSGCDWIATSNSSWIDVLTPSGSGSGEVSFKISKNTAPNEQTGTVKISGRSPNSTYEGYFNVTQAGMPVCSYSITPSLQNFTASGGNGSFNLVTSTGCTWTATNNCGWVTLTNASGSGTSAISYTVSANTTTSSRTCTVTVNGQTYTITQSGVSCNYSISSNSQSFASTVGNGSFSLTTSTGCAWTASADCNWVNVTNTSGSGASAISYTVSANTTTSSRTCIITVNGQIYTITQSGASCNYSISPSSQSFASTGGNGSFNLTTSNGCAWTASVDCNWVTVTNASGSGASTVNYTFSANTTTSSRTCTITINSQIYTVNQAASNIQCSYTLSTPAVNVGSAASSSSFNITTGSSCTWTAAQTSASSWLTNITPSGTGNGTVAMNIAACPNTSNRMGTINVSGQNGYSENINVIQICSNTQCDLITPIIVAGNCDLRVDAQADCNYQWQKSGNNIGTNSRFLAITQSGFYTCTVTKLNNSTCSKASKDLYMLFNSGTCTVNTNEIQSLKNFLVYPNPNHGLINLEFELSEVKDVELKIYNSIGQQIYNNRQSKFTGKYKQQINLSNASIGIYFVVLDIDNQKITKRFVIN